MKNWEKEYQAYNSIEEDEKINELEQKVKDKSISKKEYSELKTKKNIRANIDKVSNILELRDTLVEKKEEIKKEIDRRNTLKNTSKDQEKLEKRLNEILLKQDELKQDLKKPDLKEEDREKIQTEIVKLNAERDDNNNSFKKNQDILMQHVLSDKNELSKMKDEELEKENFEISTKVSKCNMVGHCLMKGLNWNAIELKLDNWQDKKFKAKSTPIKKIKEKEIEKKVSKPKEEQEKEPEATNIMDPKEVDLFEKKMKEKIAQSVKSIKEEKNNLPAEKGFFGKHPKIKKALDSIKDKFNKILRRKTPYEKYMQDKYKNKENTGSRRTPDGYKEAMKKQDEIVKQKEKEREERFKKEQAEQEKIETRKNNEFKEYLRKVAEKGMVNIEKEKTDAKEAKYQEYKKAKEERMEANGDQVIHASKEYREYVKEQDNEPEI